MRLLTYALVLLSLLTCIGVLYIRHETQAAEQAIRAEQQPSPEPQVAPAAPSAPAAAVDPAPSEKVNQLVAGETRSLRSLTNHPERDAARIRAEASALNAEDCAGLAVVAEHLSVHPDKRFAAVYLLTKADPSVAVSALARIALSPVPPGNPEETRFERILRSLALEGLSEAHGSSVAETALIQVSEGDSPLRGRARQALAAFLGKKPPVAQQDEALLSDLIARAGTSP